MVAVVYWGARVFGLCVLPDCCLAFPVFLVFAFLLDPWLLLRLLVAPGWPEVRLPFWDAVLALELPFEREGLGLGLGLGLLDLILWDWLERLRDTFGLWVWDLSLVILDTYINDRRTHTYAEGSLRYA
jgi:hypothetical protein